MPIQVNTLLRKNRRSFYSTHDLERTYVKLYGRDPTGRRPLKVLRAALG